jgi:hypothetical protein
MEFELAVALDYLRRDNQHENKQMDVAFRNQSRFDPRVASSCAGLLCGMPGDGQGQRILEDNKSAGLAWSKQSGDRQ